MRTDRTQSGGAVALRALADDRDLSQVEVDVLDHQLMHELGALNGILAQYLVRHHETKANRVTPTPVADERALADSMTAAGKAIRARADRRTRQATSTTPRTEDA